MKIVIDIPDDEYKKLVNPYQYNEALCDELKMIVRNGTPLPKGHGGLIDRSKIYKAIPAEEDNCTGMGMTIEEMKEPTLELLIKSLINDFREYQKEWMTSHNDIEFEKPDEDLILEFLDDTANCYISEHIE